MATQEYIKINKRLAKGDNWKFTGTLVTGIPDIDTWEKKMYIQSNITSDPLVTIDMTGSDKEYTGELTKAQSVTLDRRFYFIKIVARKPNEEMRTLSSEDSTLYIF